MTSKLKRFQTYRAGVGLIAEYDTLDELEAAQTDPWGRALARAMRPVTGTGMYPSKKIALAECAKRDGDWRVFKCSARQWAIIHYLGDVDDDDSASEAPPEADEGGPEV
jgi:hypothetical protein